MTKANGKSKELAAKKLEKLSLLKFHYDLLSNELFHLKEFMSTIEFDPCYSNDTESYQRFLREENLTLNTLQPNENGGSIKAADANNGLRRRQLRASTAAPKSAESAAKDDSTQWLNEVEPFVRAEYEKLEMRLEDGQSRAAVNHIKSTTSAVKRSLTRKLVQKKHSKHYKPSINDEDQLILGVKKQNHVREEKPYKSSVEPKDESVEEVDVNDNANDNDDDDDFYFTTSSEDEEETKRKPTRKRPHIKLVVHPPKQTVTNPLHAKVPQFKNLHEYLNSFKSMDEDVSIEEYERYISEQKQTVSAIRRGLESGALRYDPDTDSVQAITTKDARLTQSHRPDPVSYFYKQQNLQTFQEYLINHGIYMSKLFQNNRRARISRARKVSQMIEQHFKHIAGAEERLEKEEEKKKRALARAAVQAVKKRWTLAERAYRVLRKDEEEKLKRLKGKEHLSKMLEQSTQLLEAQLNQNVEEVTETSASESDSGSEDEEEDDELLTSSSEEEMKDEEHNKTLISDEIAEDESLTVEELQKKYQSANHVVKYNNEYKAEENSDRSNLSEEKDSDDDLSITTEESSSEQESSQEEVEGEGEEGTNIGLGSLLEKQDDSEEDDGEDYIAKYSEAELEEDQIEGENQESDDTAEEEQRESTTEMRNIEGGENGKRSQENGKSFLNGQDKSAKDSFNSESDPLSVVDVPVPSLLRGTLRIYQKQGLNWMASLYNNNTNGILADEMGLGKTIQTISLLAYLACEKQNWGPHLIVVPTSVLLNWEMELKRFAPGFKVLTYYGSPQQRKEKRKGWNKPDAFHICIVSYQLVVQDQNSFKRKRWEYMILDEAHNIKNFRSTRWQALLNFNTRRRLLLTGTPLQNNIAELWSLLYFLMPQTITDGKGVSGFADLEAFQQWFGRPVDKVIETGGDYQQDAETKKTVNKLHQVLRPYLLRRLKADVEKQMPAKYEHIVYCRLSKRQRFLYDDFMSRAQTKATLASGNFMSIVNCLMQLRKVCNHPDLFEVRPILTSFCAKNSVAHLYTDMNRFINKLLIRGEYESKVNLNSLNLVFSRNDLHITSHHSQSIEKLQCVDEFVKQVSELREQSNLKAYKSSVNSPLNLQIAVKFFEHLGEQKLQRTIDSLESMKYVNHLRCEKKPVYGKNLVDLLMISDTHHELSGCLAQCSKPLQDRFTSCSDVIENYAVLTPSAVTLDIRGLTLALNDDSLLDENLRTTVLSDFHNLANPFHHLQTKLTIAFPDKSLLQYDCGKLQKLATLLQDLKDNGHRALIFTQMTKVLDILEQFLNYHGYLYMRLDGATKIEDRQILTERFNSDPRVTVFILSSRSGGLGINLTGADTVIFYDSDWNPAMDKQCQDRCHRIGQTRDVHIYRFVSEHTIESNILKKANQKRQLDTLVIQKGDFTTDYFTKLSVKDMLGSDVPAGVKIDDKPLLLESSGASKDPRRLEKLLAQAEDADDVKAANLAMKEVEVDDEDFTEQANTEAATSSDQNLAETKMEDEYEGTNHVEEYMLRFIANGYYY